MRKRRRLEIGFVFELRGTGAIGVELECGEIAGGSERFGARRSRDGHGFARTTARLLLGLQGDIMFRRIAEYRQHQQPGGQGAVQIAALLENLYSMRLVGKDRQAPFACVLLPHACCAYETSPPHFRPAPDVCPHYYSTYWTISSCCLLFKNRLPVVFVSVRCRSFSGVGLRMSSKVALLKRKTDLCANRKQAA